MITYLPQIPQTLSAFWKHRRTSVRTDAIEINAFTFKPN